MQVEDEYYNDPEFLELLEEYEQAEQTGMPVFMDAEDLADIAGYYQSAGRPDDAQKAIEKALEQDPESETALIFKVHEALDAEVPDVQLAQDYLDRIYNKDLPEYVYCQAEIFIVQDKPDEADKYLRKCLADVPPDEYQDYVLDVANIYSDYGLNELAMQWMMRARHDNSEDFQELMARTLFGLGKYDDCERIFTDLIDKNPFQKRYWNALASTQFMKEEYDASIASSEYAIAIDPDDPEGLVSKANGLYRLGNYKEALKYFERYSKQVPDDEFGLLHQGTCLVNLDRRDEAIERLKEAEAIAPDDSPYLADIYQELGFAYSEAGMLDLALEYIDKTKDLDCDHIDMLVIRGHILLSNNRRAEAEQMFKKAIYMSDSAPDTLLRIIISMFDNGYAETAYATFKRFFEITEEDYDKGYSYMALCCWELDKTDEFMVYLKLACEKNPQEAQLVLSSLFPDGLKVDDYYNYMKEDLKK